MSVLLETSVGEIVVDLLEEAPLASANFLKLCKLKYYNNVLFYNVQANYIAQTGDPTGTGRGGSSVKGIIEESDYRFKDEIHPSRKHTKKGLVSMAGNGNPNSNQSQFFITLRADDLGHLDGKHTIFGEVAEGFEVLDTLSSLYCDEIGRPFQDVRIHHTYVLDDPYPDPPGFPEGDIPSPASEKPNIESVKGRIPYEMKLDEENHQSGKTEEDIALSTKRKEAASRAIVLEMTGDIPDAEAKPPSEVLFVCKLNPVTTDEDLELLFSRFGRIKDCSIIRDMKTGDSLCYAFIEYDTEEACVEAYHKMNNVLIDDRRIKVDFSQSVSKIWNRYMMESRKKNRKGNGQNATIEISREQSLGKRERKHSIDIEERDLKRR
jgi:peptidyl-prolyl cis-trans isomerase-like 4